MFERFKAWVHKQRKGLVITGVIVGIVGTVAIVLINSRKVKIPVDEFATRIVPDVAKPTSPKVLTNITQDVIPTAVEVAETVTVEEDGVLKTFPRAEFIRKLHDGWNASAPKLAQAAEMGIDLKPGETIVNACTVTMKVA
jgi:hypothetical protein